MDTKKIFLHLYEMEVWLNLAAGLPKPQINKSWNNFLKDSAEAYGVSLTEIKKELGAYPPKSPDFNFPITKQITKAKTGFYVQLQSVANPDYMHTRSGREEQNSKKIGKHYYKVSSEKEGALVVNRFRTLFELGIGNFPNAPLIWACNLKVVGEYSYNGHFWPKNK